MNKFNELYSSIFEKDEHKKSKSYRKLAPKMKKAVDGVFDIMDSKPSDFINSFEKTIKNMAKKFRVTAKELMNYFEREMLTLGN